MDVIVNVRRLTSITYICILLLTTTVCANYRINSSSSYLQSSPVTSMLSCAGSIETPEAPSSERGRASLSGVLYSYSISCVIPGTVFYLVKRKTNEHLDLLFGPSAESGDIRGISDNMGKFVLANIPPGQYYLAVWAPYNWILAVESPEETKPRLFIIEPNRRYNFGIIYVPWP